MSVYKEKFFSKLYEFINDKNYIKILKDKCHEITYNYKCINELDEKYLGNKRKRDKMYIIDETSNYDIELKLLKNDYPKFDSKEDESAEYLLVKKDKNVEIVSSIPPIPVNLRKVKKDNEDKNTISDNNNNNDISKKNNNSKELNDGNKTNSNYFLLDDKDEIINEENNNKTKGTKSKKKGILSKLKHVTFDSKDEIISPIKVEKNSNLLKNTFLQKYSSQLNSLEEINSLICNTLSNNDSLMSENSEFMKSLMQNTLGANTRFEKMPLFTIPAKRCDIKFNNSENNLDEIKENNNNEEDMDDNQSESKNDEKNNENNNNNNNINNEKTEINDIQNKICNENNSQNKPIDSNLKIKEEKDTDSINNNEDQKESTTKKNEDKKIIEPKIKSEPKNKPDPKIKPEPEKEIVKNENIIILNTLLLEYNNTNGNKIIKKSIEIPNSVIIQKKMLNMEDILFSNKNKKKYFKRKEKKKNNEEECVEIKDDGTSNIKNITNITNIKSNSINDNNMFNKPNNISARRRNVVLMEKTICEEENYSDYNIYKKNGKSNNVDNNNNTEKLDTTDILHGFNYLYQQKSI